MKSFFVLTYCPSTLSSVKCSKLRHCSCQSWISLLRASNSSLAHWPAHNPHAKQKADEGSSEYHPEPDSEEVKDEVDRHKEDDKNDDSYNNGDKFCVRLFRQRVIAMAWTGLKVDVVGLIQVGALQGHSVSISWSISTCSMVEWRFVWMYEVCFVAIKARFWKTACVRVSVWKRGNIARFAEGASAFRKPIAPCCQQGHKVLQSRWFLAFQQIDWVWPTFLLTALLSLKGSSTKKFSIAFPLNKTYYGGRLFITSAKNIL